MYVMHASSRIEGILEFQGIKTFRDLFYPTIASASCDIKDGTTGL